MTHRATLTIPPDPEAEDDLHFFGSTVEISDTQAEAVLAVAGLAEPKAQITIAELAKLPALEYDRQRDSAAKALSVRSATLDDEVKKARASAGSASKVGRTAVLFTDPEPWPHPVGGAELLNEIAGIVRRFMVLPDGAADTVALWLLHAWAHSAFRVSPVLAIGSPEKRCGKTSLLTILQHIAPRPLPASNITAAALFRAVEKWQPTLLIDEADTFLRDSDELRGVLNSGHTRDTACVIRTVGEDHEPRVFSTWAPKTIALIGKLPPTLHDRAIEIRLARKLPGEQVERLRAERADFEDVRRRCARWTADHASLRDADPDVPDGLNDRAADNWRPLLAIAVAAGGTWPELARKAITALADAGDSDDAGGIMLLDDLRGLFATRGNRLLSADIAEALAGMEHRPWPEWHHGKPITPRQIARLLRPFGIQPKTIRAATDRAKGYEVEQFADVFSRYLPLIRDSVTTLENEGFSENPIRDTETAVTDQISRKGFENKACHAVTDRTPQTGRLRL